MKINTRLILWLIVGLAFIVRVWSVGSLPAILNRDEAALAYNSYLLMETGRDEWNRQWPMTLESFGDYKLPGYSVLLIPFFKVFGLHDWVVRLPSVLAGTMLVGLVYHLARKFEFDEKNSLLMSLLVAVAPVFVFYSRMGFEANVALTYFTGALLTLLCLKDNFRWWKYGVLALLLLLAVLTYNTPLLLLPMLMIFAALIFPKKNRKGLIAVELTLGAIVAIGIVLFLPAAAQKSGITIFTDETVWSQWTAFRAGLPGIWQALLGSKYVYYLMLMARNFIDSFSISFLVTNGGTHPWHSLPTTGHLEALVYIFGLAGMVKTSIQVWLGRSNFASLKQPLALLFLLIASLAPSIVTVDSPHATRSLLFFLLFHVFALLGIQWFVSTFNAQKAQLAGKLIVIGVLAEALLHTYQLFSLYPTQQAVFQPGFDTTIQEIDRTHSAEPVAVVDPQGYQYIILAWYLKLPPEVYFSTIIRQLPDRIGFRYGQQLTHYHFIAAPADRSAQEPILVQWSGQAEAWQVQKDL